MYFHLIFWTFHRCTATNCVSLMLNVQLWMHLRRPGCRRLLLHAILTIYFFSFVDAILWPFRPKRFRGNTLLRAGSLGLSGDGRVVAFGDFNGDQSWVVISELEGISWCWSCFIARLDVLVLNPDQQTLTVYYWNHGALTHPLFYKPY
jgi:integrin alpha FG-GAP repeat containing protein 1